MMDQKKKEIIDQYIEAYIEENLPRVVNEILDERIKQENLKALKRFMDPDLKIFEF